MSHRFFARLRWLPAVAILAQLAQTPAAGQQAATTAPKKSAAPASSKPAVARTAWGDPDLQGVYTFATLTPFQRPAAQAGKAVLTGEGTEALEGGVQKNQEEDNANQQA